MERIVTPFATVSDAAGDEIFEDGPPQYAASDDRYAFLGANETLKS